MRKIKETSSITIEQVAREAGVSTATVSRVINKNDAVSPELQAQVRKVIDRLGYKPNRSARNLRAGKVRKVGVLFADIQNPFFTSVLAGIEATLQQADYVLLLGNSNEDPRIEQMHLQVFQEEGVAGIILAAATNTPNIYQEVIRSGIPILALDRAPGGLRVDSVSINNIETAAMATHHLIKLGHKDIAFIGGPETISTARLRREGYQKALQESGIDFTRVELSNYRQSGGYDAMRRLLSTPPIPSAVLVANNLMTLGALQAIHESGKKIPQQIALVGFDDMPWATSLQPPLTVVAQPTYELGSIAVRLLLDRIQYPDGPIQQVTLATHLIVRESCGGKLAAIPG
ncbi:MAG: LacI family transcriptional regulator [Veillonellaceae bacterium]|nr:LacI family transcriptional regulator [Veillonellaceae bacterium]